MIDINELRRLAQAVIGWSKCNQEIQARGTPSRCNVELGVCPKEKS